MRYSVLSAVFGLILFCQSVYANDKAKTAIGAGAGGAIGAVIGDELGDREGAIAGAAIGAAVGTAIATDSDGQRTTRNESSEVKVVVDAPNSHPHGRHCPPGQAKKGRC